MPRVCDCLGVGGSIRFIALIVLGLSASGCTSSPTVPIEAVDSRPPTLNEAREVYRDACASCHGPTGTGDGPVAPALKSAPTDLTRLSERHGGVFPRELVIRTVTGDNAIASHGTREMPVWSQRFTPTGYGATAVAAIYARRQVELVVTYVESLQRQ